MARSLGIRENVPMRDTPLRISLGLSGQKLFRLDKPSHALVESDPERDVENGRLWNLIWGKVSAAAQERRGGVRHPVVSHEIWVGWSARDQFVALDGVMVNISRGGALILLKDRPPRDRPVWVYKDVAGLVRSVRGEVVGFTPAPGGAYAVRFRFATPCPTILCESAVCGEPSVPQATQDGARPVPEFRP
jgi:PilZ domain